MLYVCKEINKQKKHSPGKKNKGENKAFKKKQTKRRTFTHVFFQNKSFFFNRNIEMATFFFVCSKHYCFVHTKKAFFALFFGFALLLEQKKKTSTEEVFFYLFFFLFFVLFLKLVFVNPVSTQQPFFGFRLKLPFRDKNSLKEVFELANKKSKGFSSLLNTKANKISLCFCQIKSSFVLKW